MDLMQSAELVQRAALTGEPRAQLTARIFEAGLQYVLSNGISDPNPQSLLAHPLNETGMRRGLESSYRALARYSESPDERIQLVDRANRVRPRTLV
jgi:serine/threonine-protein kinase PknG